MFLNFKDKYYIIPERFASFIPFRLFGNVSEGIKVWLLFFFHLCLYILIYFKGTEINSVATSYQIRVFENLKYLCIKNSLSKTTIPMRQIIILFTLMLICSDIEKICPHKWRGITFQSSKSHLKILGIRRLIRSNFRKQNTQTLSVNVQIVATATWCPRFVYLWL
jgi:hypothetical protein